MPKSFRHFVLRTELAQQAYVCLSGRAPKAASEEIEFCSIAQRPSTTSAEQSIIDAVRTICNAVYVPTSWCKCPME